MKLLLKLVVVYASLILSPPADAKAALAKVFQCDAASCTFALPRGIYNVDRSDGPGTWSVIAADKSLAVYYDATVSTVLSGADEAMVSDAYFVSRIRYIKKYRGYILASRSKERNCRANATVFSRQGYLMHSLSVCANKMSQQSLVEAIANSFEVLEGGSLLLPENPFPLPIVPSEAAQNLSWANADAKFESGEFQAALRSAISANTFEMQLDPLYLARFYAKANQIEDGLAMFAAAASDNQIDINSIQYREQFAAFQKHAKFPLLLKYLAEQSRYWDQKRRQDIQILTPKSFDLAKSTPIVLAMHGYGSIPNDFSGDAEQKLSDDLGVIVVSVSATYPISANQFSWAENAFADKAHLDFALSQVRARFPKLKLGKKVLFGFSQGAQMALEVAARFPDEFAGAIAFSPGTLTELQLKNLRALKQLRGQRYVIRVNQEHEKNIAWAKADAQRLRASGAKVDFFLDAGVGVHAIPKNYATHMQQWVRHVLIGEKLP